MKRFAYYGGFTAGSVALLTPMLASAQTVQQLFQTVTSIINWLIPLFFAIAVAFFLWGLLKFFFAGGDATARGDAINLMIWGVIVLFIMISVWGLVRVLDNTFGLESDPLDRNDLPTSPLIQ